MYTVLTIEAKNLLEHLCHCGIPLELSVSFLLRVQGVGVQEAAAQAGCHRSLFYMALAGRRTPPPALIAVLEEKLGCDPWQLEAQMQLQPPHCKWTPDDDGVYHTDCGETFVFEAGGPAENNMRYCPYCSRPLT